MAIEEDAERNLHGRLANAHGRFSRPSSVVPVTTTYNAKDGLHGKCGTDDEHANIAEASKALTATRLNIGSATDLAAIRNKSGCHWEKGD